MPSADMRAVVVNGGGNPLGPPLRGPEFNISAKDMEGLVSEIKENLRLSASSLKAAVPCRHLCRKSSRASPYCVPGRVLCSCEAASSCERKGRRKRNGHEHQDDPYEFLQQLLRDGSLVNEAVRRVQLGLTPKQRYFYESDDEQANSPIVLCSQDN